MSVTGLLSATPLRRCAVPADFVIYRCKISGGRVIEIPLPPKFTQADVDLIYAFLKAQIYDPAE